MDRRLSFPQFQKAPSEYDPQYMNNMVNMLNALMVSLRNPGEGRQTSMVLTALPTNDSGIEPGAVFSVNGSLKVSTLNTAYLAGVQGKSIIGAVGVTIA